MLDAVDIKINKARYLLSKMSKKKNSHRNRKLKYREKRFLRKETSEQ